MKVDAGVSDEFVEAVRVVYEERLDDFCSVAAAVTRDCDGARDVVHDAFAAALRSRGQYRGEGDLAAWVWRIVVNAALDERRRRHVDGTETVEEIEDASSRQNEFADGRLAAAIQSLPERQRLAVFLRYYADLEYRQIGEVLRIATGTVSAALSAAHHTLARQLNEVEQ